MIQVNLLPDVKQEYIKAERSRRLVLSVSIIVAAASVGLLLLLFSVDRLQRKHIDDLTTDITKKSQELQKKPNIGRILTVQNQLKSLTALHEGKPASSRLFTYLNQLTPTQVDITNFNIDFTLQTATITGTADALSSVNKYIDTLKFTTYSTDQGATRAKPFSNIVLSSFSISSGGTQNKEHPATYSVTLSYDKAIFDNTQKIELTVPELTTTRSTADQGGDLFKAAPVDSTKKVIN
jgi:hypothetical protein